MPCKNTQIIILRQNTLFKMCLFYAGCGCEKVQKIF